MIVKNLPYRNDREAILILKTRLSEQVETVQPVVETKLLLWLLRMLNK